jgi:hypothetical protein
MTDPNEPPEPPESPPPSKPNTRSRGSGTGGAGGGRDQQIAAILEIVGNLVRDQRRLEGQFNRLVKTLREQERASKDETEDDVDPNAPAPWVWFSPPAPDEPETGDEEDFEEDPQVFVTNFVAWYNVTFVGIEGGRAKAIPACWESHPGLAMEVASLAYTWRTANLGPEASIKEAQYFLHQWRPGFADRLVRDWVHTDCVDGQHQAVGARTRDNRFVVNQQPAAPPLPSSPVPPPPFPPGPPTGWSSP